MCFLNAVLQALQTFLDMHPDLTERMKALLGDTQDALKKVGVCPAGIKPKPAAIRRA
jgi:hypothetical protein